MWSTKNVHDDYIMTFHISIHITSRNPQITNGFSHSKVCQRVESHREISHYRELHSGKRVYITNWKDPPSLLGKLTISTGPFSSSQSVSHYQRVQFISIHNIILAIHIKSTPTSSTFSGKKTKKLDIIQPNGWLITPALHHETHDQWEFQAPKLKVQSYHLSGHLFRPHNKKRPET